MKKCIALCLVGLFLCGVATGEISQEPSKFKVVYKITYNAVTFEEAHKIEMQVKRNHKDACLVEIEPKEESNGNLMLFSDDIN